MKEYKLSINPVEAETGTTKIVTVERRRLEIVVPPHVVTGTKLHLRNSSNDNDTIIVHLTVTKKIPFTPLKPIIRLNQKWVWTTLGGLTILVAIAAFTFKNPGDQFVPAEALRPLTGDSIVLGNKLGSGELSIENGRGQDAVVVLVTGGYVSEATYVC